MSPIRSSPRRRVRLLALLGLAAPAAAAPQGPPPTPVRVDLVRQEEVQEHRRVTGDLRALRRSRVASQEAGIVAALEVDEGSRVEAGAALARLDARRLELALAEVAAERAVAEATVAEREGDLRQAERDLASIRSLAERQAASPKELGDAETAVVVARARADEAAARRDVLAARLGLLETRLADAVVRAPFAGVVAARHVEVGEWLAAGGGVVELVSADALEAWLEVPERDLAALAGAAGAPLRLRVDATGAEVDAGTWRVVPVVDPAARTFHVVARVPEGAGRAPGMAVTAWVPTGDRGARLTVSPDAVLRNEAGTYVYVAAPGEGGSASAAPVPVEVLFRAGDRLVVRGELEAGARAIVEGNERLFPMAPVRPVEELVRPVDGPREGPREGDGAPARRGG